MEIKGKKFYLSGINGIGMSAIAQMIVEIGGIVEGSDLVYKDITKILEEKGIKVNLTQISENISSDIDYFVYSTAIPKTNHEYMKAKELGITMIKRGEMLSHIFNRFTNSIAVAGTHGKTTTSSMIAVALKKYDPYFAIGGIVPYYNNNMKLGNGDFFVAEADESDNSFLYLHPQYSIITNIEIDHLEHHHSFDNILNSFKKFIDNTKEMVLVNIDCPNISKNLDLTNKKIKTYSLYNKDADIYAGNILETEESTSYVVVYKDKYLDFDITIPGIHNVSNTLPVIYLLLSKGIQLEDIRDALYEFRGAGRRFQILENKEYKIIDDYGHHPTEIKATIEATRTKYKGYKINLIFEPHRYTRTHFFKQEFIDVLKLADKVYLLPIYAASEENIYNISSDDLVIEINKEEQKALCINYDNIFSYINKEEKNVYLFMGAGTVTKLAHKFKEMD